MLVLALYYFIVDLSIYVLMLNMINIGAKVQIQVNVLIDHLPLSSNINKYLLI